MNLPLQELIGKLQDGSLTAVHALEAYRAKALAVHEKTNCFTELIWEAEVCYFKVLNVDQPLYLSIMAIL